MLYINDNLDKISDDEIEELIQTLPSQRKEQALKFKFARGRKECVISYMLLCHGLKEIFGIDEKPIFEYGEHGKPSIVGHSEVYFNISHCKNAVICAVSKEPVGVDVECIGRGNESLIDYTMNDKEKEQIKTASNPKVEFIKFWTQKEAVLKLTGEGINDNMKTVLAPANIKNISLTSTVCEDKGYVYSLANYTTIV